MPESIRIIPSDVLTAQVELPNTCGVLKESAWLPNQYRLSNTFAGGKYHSECGGTFTDASTVLPGAGSLAGGFSSRAFPVNAGLQTVSYKAVRSCPGRYAAALAMSMCFGAAAFGPSAFATFRIPPANTKAPQNRAM